MIIFEIYCRNSIHSCTHLKKKKKSTIKKKDKQAHTFITVLLSHATTRALEFFLCFGNMVSEDIITGKKQKQVGGLELRNQLAVIPTSMRGMDLPRTAGQAGICPTALCGTPSASPFMLMFFLQLLIQLPCTVFQGYEFSADQTYVLLLLYLSASNCEHLHCLARSKILN